MSIKEALERGSTDRQRTIWQEADDEAYEKECLELGLLVHREAGTPELLRELAEEVIKPDFPDVKIGESILMADGGVSLKINWNFRDVPSRLDPKYSMPVHNAISVEAYPLTNDLIVTGGRERELLKSIKWGTDNWLLEDAIVSAYQNPMTLSDIHIRL